MHTQEAREANNLYGLLADYVQSCDALEEHNRKVINNNYRTFELEREAYQYIQLKYQQPVRNSCTWFGFKYADLLEIIPPAFETNAVQRMEILEDLKVFYKKEFGRHD